MSQFTSCSVNFCICPKNCTNKPQNFPPINSHDSGSHFKKSTFKKWLWKQNSYIFVTELNLQVRLSTVITLVYTSKDMKIYTCLRKKKSRDQADVFQWASHLNTHPHTPVKSDNSYSFSSDFCVNSTVSIITPAATISSFTSSIWGSTLVSFPSLSKRRTPPAGSFSPFSPPRSTFK